MGAMEAVEETPAGRPPKLPAVPPMPLEPAGQESLTADAQENPLPKSPVVAVSQESVPPGTPLKNPKPASQGTPPEPAAVPLEPAAQEALRVAAPDNSSTKSPVVLVSPESAPPSTPSKNPKPASRGTPPTRPPAPFQPAHQEAPRVAAQENPSPKSPAMMLSTEPASPKTPSKNPKPASRGTPPTRPPAPSEPAAEGNLLPARSIDSERIVEAEVGDEEDSSGLSSEILELIVGRLPPTVPVLSYGWLRIIMSLPRPCLLLPDDGMDEWTILLPTRLALRGEILSRWQLDADLELRYTTAVAMRNLGIPASPSPPRLVGGHPSHPIFILQDRLCVICNVNTKMVCMHTLPLLGRTAEDNRVLRGSVSCSLLSIDPQEHGDSAMVLLATSSHIFGRPVTDNSSRSWAVGSLRGIVHGNITDLLFSSGVWYAMDETRRLYRVSCSELTLKVLEVQVNFVPATIYRNVRRHWLLQWPDGSVVCICLQSHEQEPVGQRGSEACYLAYVLQLKEGGSMSWFKLSYLHNKSVFINGGQGTSFAVEYPRRWGLQENVVYHSDFTTYDLSWAHFPNGLPPEEDEVQWPFPMWLLFRRCED